MLGKGLQGRKRLDSRFVRLARHSRIHLLACQDSFGRTGCHRSVGLSLRVDTCYWAWGRNFRIVEMVDDGELVADVVERLASAKIAGRGTFHAFRREVDGCSFSTLDSRSGAAVPGQKPK